MLSVVFLLALVAVASAGSDVAPFNIYAGGFDAPHFLALAGAFFTLSPFFVSWIMRSNSPQRVVKAFYRLEQGSVAQELSSFVWAFRILGTFSALFVGFGFASIFYTDAWYSNAVSEWGIITVMVLWFVHMVMRAWWPGIVYNDSLKAKNYPMWMALPVAFGYIVHLFSTALLLAICLIFFISGIVNYAAIRTVPAYVGTNTAFWYLGWSITFISFLMEVAIFIVNIAMHRQASVRALYNQYASGHMHGKRY